MITVTMNHRAASSAALRNEISKPEAELLAGMVYDETLTVPDLIRIIRRELGEISESKIFAVIRELARVSVNDSAAVEKFITEAKRKLPCKSST